MQTLQAIPSIPRIAAEAGLRKFFSSHPPREWQLGRMGGGFRVYATPPKMSAEDRTNLLLGRHESAEVEILKGLGRYKTVIEIGAHFGALTLESFDHNLMDGGRLIAVEPNPASIAPLRKNLEAARRRHPDRHFEIVSAALCGHNGGLVPFVQRDNLSSAVCSDTEIGENEIVVAVKKRSLSSLLDQFAPDEKDTALILLNCDAERAEFSALAHDSRAFSRFTDILIELHTAEPRETIEKFRDLGFGLTKILHKGSCVCCLFERDRPSRVTGLQSSGAVPMLTG